MPCDDPSDAKVTRRQFVKASGAAAAVAPLVVSPLLSAVSRGAYAGGAHVLRVGVIGCGGRGTGAAVNALEAAENTRVVALADVFADRLDSCRLYLTETLPQRRPELAQRIDITADRCHIGFEAYRALLADAVDVVILATPPHFRPIHFEAAVNAGKHIFAEKPVAVDAPGVRRFLAAGEEAKRKGLTVVAGTQRRHEYSYLDAMQKVREGAIGRILAARCYWNMGSLWMQPRQPEWSDMEWQLRNWLYFTWLSGDHIVEQHMHNLDVINWALGTHPIRALGLGGRQVRTGPEYGHIFDHFAVEYEYPGGEILLSMCRQMDGCANAVKEVLHGTEGIMTLWPGHASLTEHGPPARAKRIQDGAHALEAHASAPRASRWRFSRENCNPYVQEHVNLFAGIASGRALNESQSVAESTLTAIMGRMSAYTGQEVTWEQALNLQEDLTPPHYEFGDLPVPPVAAPGKTPLI